uniref:Uncharacterized protein n=1 Tax=Trypanosoma congolense (strain IL3000) TaxID=1068625 RepID=G0UZD8_TRYCI|nr:conserved hypothetical protein [Trypanosoma congolense IL3000]
MLRRFALTSNVVLWLRFDRDPASDAVRYRPLPESMQPKRLEDDFTPFPLPKFDDDLGYGPVRLQNIPDIEVAKERSQRDKFTLSRVMLHDTVMGEGTAAEATEGCSDSAAVSVTETMEKEDHPTSSYATGSPLQTISPGEEDDDVMAGYAVSKDFPLIDRLYCTRSIDDLIYQFEHRPHNESRSAALADMASSLPLRSDAELLRMLESISSPFPPDGRGLNFLTVKVRKYGRPYYVSNMLLTAYVNLINAATVVLVHEQPWRLSDNPALFIQLLHFMALIKIFEPNKWFTFSDNAPSNRADYKHPTGINNSTAFWGTGEELFDFMVRLVQPGGDGAVSSVLELCSDDQLVDLLSGFCAVLPDGKATGDVFNAITRAFLQRLRGKALEPCTPKAFSTIERMYFVTVLCDAGIDELLQLLLADSSCPRGPDFFAAVARTKEAAIQQKALALLQESLDVASAKREEVAILALLESGYELLLSVRDKVAAYAFAVNNMFDYHILNSFQHCSTVAERLRDEQTSIASNIPETLRDVQAQLRTSNERRALGKTATAAQVEGNSHHTVVSARCSIRTMLSQLEYLNSVDNVFILHSSLLRTATNQLVAAVRRLSSGKDSLIVTMSCLRSISVKSVTSHDAKERTACATALDIIAYELEKGRAVLLPLSEEILLHDAGTYCDEDLMLWTVAAFFARELPLVKVHTLIHSGCTARNPYRFLKGGHNLLVSSFSLHDKEAPLLSSLYSKELKLVTHNVRLMKQVCDRKCTLNWYNPVRARFVYRRDKALFDKYHVTARNLAPGFSRGALGHDWRGLGVYTPDHSQIPYRPVPSWMLGRSEVKLGH